MAAKPLPITVPGTTGLRTSRSTSRNGNGYRARINEEFLRELQGVRGVQTYREMSENDPVIGACIGTITDTIQDIDWTVEAGEDEKATQFVEECLADMRPNFQATISEILSFMVYGWSWMVPSYKRRAGDVSNYEDGKIGWDRWEIRAQESLYEWQFDERNRLLGMWQAQPNAAAPVFIPLSQSLHFRTSVAKNNPEGRSLLRNAYTAWYEKTRVNTFELIGLEKDLTGFGVIFRDESLAYLDEQLKHLLMNAKIDEDGGIILPLKRDIKTGERLLTYEPIGTPGTKPTNPRAAIEARNLEIALAIRAAFIFLGHENVGSFALSKEITDIYTLSCGSLLRAVASPINEQEIPRLLRLNGMPTKNPPQLSYGSIKPPDIQSIGDYMKKLSETGLPLWPNEALESYALDVASLPHPSEEEIRIREERALEMRQLAQEGLPDSEDEEDEDEPEDEPVSDE